MIPEGRIHLGVLCAVSPGLSLTLILPGMNLYCVPLRGEGRLKEPWKLLKVTQLGSDLPVEVGDRYVTVDRGFNTLALAA